MRHLNPGTIAAGLLAALPLLLALPGLSWSGGAAPVLQSAGRACGILGLGLMLVNGAVSARLPRLDAWFGGLTDLWKLHHYAGAAALVLVMAHPVLLAFAAVPGSPDAAAATLFPAPGVWAVWVGWLALLALMAFLAPSFAFFGEPDYQRWKGLHMLSGPVLLLAGIHAVPLARALESSVAMALWPALTVLALATWVFRSFLAPRLGRRRYTVADIERLAPDVVEVRLEPEGESLAYRSGQFVYLTPLDPQLSAGRGEEHPYTLSSAPQEAGIRMGIKREGDATAALQRVAVGSEALVEGPYGAMFPGDRVTEPEIWIGGGIGVTPFVARARMLEATGQVADAHLFYLVQSEDRAYYLDELQRIAQAGTGLQLWLHQFEREGPLAASFLESRCADVARRAAYLCGPAVMIDLARAELAACSVPRRQIRWEEFTFL